MSIIMDDGKDKIESYAGCVISTRERNLYHDSDFLAVVWDENEGRIKEVEYATTRFYTYNNVAKVDVTPERLALAQKWAYNSAKKIVWESYIRNLRKPAKGDKVVVARGRKVAHGTEGVLFYIGDSYGFGANKQTKIGVAVSDRKENGRYVDVVWTYLHNVDAIASYKFNLTAIKRRLQAIRQEPINNYLYA